MNKDSLKKIITYIKNPVAQLVTVILVGLVFNLYLFSSKIQPDFLEKTLLNQIINNLENQRNVIAQSPLPVEVDPKEIESLILQVPTVFEISRLLLEFEDVERDTGAIINDLAIGAQEAEVKDELAEYIENALKKSPAIAAAIPTNSTDSELEAEQPVPVPIEPKLTTPIKPEIVSLHVNGSYEQVTDFMGRLYKMNRIVNIRKWSLAPTEGDQYEMELGLTVYTAPKYAGTFHDLQAISSDIPTKDGIPVMTDEEFKRILELEP